MKKVVAEGNIPYLPQEIVRNILKRLPVKSLIRFQCVCKHWKNLFKTPSFIADHLHHSSNQNPSLLFQRNGRSAPFNLCVFDCEMLVREVQNAPLINSLLCNMIIGSSNGLLLLSIQIAGYGKFLSSLLLWNPATREVRKVPGTINHFKGDFVLGFGFSAIVNDYKIMRTYADFDYVVNRVEVYSLSTGSWKKIELGNLEGVRLFRETVSANGAMFWKGSKLGVEEEGEDDIDLIVSFDIAMEVFTLMPWPAVYSDSISELTVYDNKVTMLCHTHTVIGNLMMGNFESTLVDLWVLEEGTGASRERCSWTKKYTSSPACLLRPVTIWRNEIVSFAGLMPRLISKTEREVQNDERKTVISLSNLSTDEFKILSADEFKISRCSQVPRIFNYVESLVPLGNILNEEPRS